jgi:hypothetical protein
LKRLFLLGFSLLLLALSLTACGSGDGALLTDVTPDAGQLDLASGVNAFDAVNVQYKIGKVARVSIRLQTADGQTIRLRENEERTPGDYVLRLNGAIETVEEGLPQTRLLPNGRHRYTLNASAGGESSEASGSFEIRNSRAAEGVPQVEGLNVSPTVISPNFDAREDTALLGWRTTKPATVTISVSGANGFSKILKTIKNQPAREDKISFNGLDVLGEPLADGVYTYTIEAADLWGNVARRAGTLEVKGGGRPVAVIEQVTIGPTEIIRGGTITVTARVRNTGKVPIRSQGPDSGYAYSTREVFSSIESGKFTDAAGYWRIGVDYESNSGGGASRYPFRWGFGKEVLLPGEAVDVVGVIKIERNEEKLRFYVGLIQEQIALPQDRIQNTEIKISF